MLVKLYARDNAHLMELLNNRLQEIEGVISTETLISLKQSIKTEIPIGLNEADVAAIKAMTARKAGLLTDSVED
jgi:DNA-binding Lrp family transcriptional regulator